MTTVRTTPSSTPSSPRGGEQVLSHGIPLANDDLAPAPTEDIAAPVVRAPDGYGLSRLVAPIVDGDIIDPEAGARALEASDMWGV